LPAINGFGEDLLAFCSNVFEQDVKDQQDAFEQIDRKRIR